MKKNESLNREVFEDLYNKIEKAKPSQECYFQGVKYKIGSNELNEALYEWYKINAKK